MFAVGRTRGVDVASAFAISDSLADGEWVPQFGHPRLAQRLTRMIPAAVSALTTTSWRTDRGRARSLSFPWFSDTQIDGGLRADLCSELDADLQVAQQKGPLVEPPFGRATVRAPTPRSSQRSPLLGAEVVLDTPQPALSSAGGLSTAASTDNHERQQLAGRSTRTHRQLPPIRILVCVSAGVLRAGRAGLFSRISDSRPSGRCVARVAVAAPEWAFGLAGLVRGLAKGLLNTLTETDVRARAAWLFYARSPRHVADGTAQWEGSVTPDSRRSRTRSSRVIWRRLRMPRTRAAGGPPDLGRSWATVPRRH